MEELPGFQKIHLRIVRQLAGLDFFVLHQFGDFVPKNIAIDHLREAFYESPCAIFAKNRGWFYGILVVGSCAYRGDLII